MMVVDHMESNTHCSRTRCGQKSNSVKGYVFDYGDAAARCKTCRKLHAQDVIKAAEAARIKKTYKCIRTDCGIGGCVSGVKHTHPPEFCLYDFDEAHWVEIKGGDSDE